MNLAQSSAFRPFMRKFISLRDVTRWTRQHDIRRRMGTAARQWNNVIYVVYLAQLASTIIAFPLLSFILPSHILLGVFSTGSLLVCASFAFCQSLTFWMCFSVIPVTLHGLLFVAVIIISAPLTQFFWIATIVSFSCFAFLSSAFLGRRTGMCSSIFSPISLIMFFVAHMPVLAISQALFPISKSRLFILFSCAYWIYLSSSFSRISGIYTSLLRMCQRILSHFSLDASFTATNELSISFVEVSRIGKIFFTAARTGLKWIGDVQHLAPRNANSHDVVGKRYECRRFGLQSLADTYILPQIGGVC